MTSLRTRLAGMTWVNLRRFSSTATPPHGGSHLFRQAVETASKRTLESSVAEFSKSYTDSLSSKAHNFERTLRREFGPAAYGVFSAKNVKACRGVRGKTFSIRINDSKWRYPERGRH